VPVGDEEELATAMLEALDQTRAPEKLKSRARLFSAEVAVGKFAHLLDPSATLGATQPNDADRLT
jgi:hypothetical protein